MTEDVDVDFNLWCVGLVAMDMVSGHMVLRMTRVTETVYRYLTQFADTVLDVGHDGRTYRLNVRWAGLGHRESAVEETRILSGVVDVLVPDLLTRRVSGYDELKAMRDVMRRIDEKQGRLNSWN